MKKKVDPASYGWSGRICHCSSPTDWISIKSLHMKKNNIWHWGLRHCVNDWSAFWILTGHRVMLCSHWLMLTLSSRVVHFLSTRSQPQYGSLAPTQALRERERERTDAHRDTKVYGNINQLRGDKRRAEVKRSCNEKSNFPSWKHTVHKFYNWQLPSQSKNIIYWH